MASQTLVSRAMRGVRGNPLPVVTYALITLLGVVLVVGVWSQSALSLEQARYNYRYESHDEAVRGAQKMV